MINAARFTRATGTHVLVTGALAKVLKRDTMGGMAMLLVEYHKNRQPEQSNVEWVYSARAVPVP